MGEDADVWKIQGFFLAEFFLQHSPTFIDDFCTIPSGFDGIGQYGTPAKLVRSSVSQNQENPNIYIYIFFFQAVAYLISIM